MMTIIINGHHGCYLALKMVSNILKKAKDENLRKSKHNSLTLLLLSPMELLY